MAPQITTYWMENQHMNVNISKNMPFGVLITPATQSTQPSIDSIDIKLLKSLFQEEQLIIIRGYNTFKDAHGFSEYCEKWGNISLWPFGKVLELIEEENPQDHIFDNNYVPLHWDGMYRPEVPEYQIFHCVLAPLKGQGGRTTFSNTIMALKNATQEELNLWKNYTGTYQRKMEFYNSKTMAPIITCHPSRGLSVIRYNEPPHECESFINPPLLEFNGPAKNSDEKKLHESLRTALYHPNNFYAHEWQVGDIVIADNFSLLHGREKFISKTPRHLRRVHVLSDPALKNPHLVYHK